MSDLVQYLEHAAPGEGMQPTAIPFARVNRRSQTRGPVAHVLPPSVWIYVSGHKRARVGQQARDLSEGGVFALSHPTTVVSEIVRTPYLGVMLTLDASSIAMLAASPRAASADISDPFARLVRLIDTPSEIPVLAPLLVVASSRVGPRLAP